MDRVDLRALARYANTSHDRLNAAASELARVLSASRVLQQARGRQLEVLDAFTVALVTGTLGLADVQGHLGASAAACADVQSAAFKAFKAAQRFAVLIQDRSERPSLAGPAQAGGWQAQEQAQAQAQAQVPRATEQDLADAKAAMDSALQAMREALIAAGRRRG